MNNHCVPDWNMVDEDSSLLHPSANQKKSMAADNELVELFWRDGHIVMHSQAHRKPPTMLNDFKQAPRAETPMRWGGSIENTSNLIQEDETVPWFQYPLVGSLDKEFCSEFFCEIPSAEATLNNEVTAGAEGHVKFGAIGETGVLPGSALNHSSACLHENAKLPPKSGNVVVNNFSHFSRRMKTDLEVLTEQFVQKGSEIGNNVVITDSSSVMVGLSACGSNQVQNLVDGSYNFSEDVTGALTRIKENVQGRPSHGGGQTNHYEAALTSSSGGSGCSFGRKEEKHVSDPGCKRKRTHGEESESHSEEAEYKAVEANKSMQRSASARRSRATEVHNLSERRRRDKINEKMRALQELIPHCNKSDKASMLDEAIQYLKSLQLQVQLMWMGGGMAPMMFPGVQQYMSCMEMGMSHANMPNMPSTHSPVQLPRVPLASRSMPLAPIANQTPVFASPTLNSVNFPTQLPNAHLPESYARFLGYQHIQPSPQGMNLYAYGPHGEDHNKPSHTATNCSSLPTSGVPS